MHPPIILTNQSLPRLFCKPTDVPKNNIIISNQHLDFIELIKHDTPLSDGSLAALFANHNFSSALTATSLHGMYDNAYGIKSEMNTDRPASGEILQGDHQKHGGCGCLYSFVSDALPGRICFRGIDLEKDLPTIHEWVNMPYTARFWQMDGSFAELKALYQKILEHPNAHSFVGFYEDLLVCQLDVYMLGVDELSLHLPDESNHCGFHLLMAPNKTRIPGLTYSLVSAFLNYYFSFPEAEKMYAEPDVRNIKSQALLRKLHFGYQRSLELSYKWAMLFCLQKEKWIEKKANVKSKI